MPRVPLLLIVLLVLLGLGAWWLGSEPARPLGPRASEAPRPPESARTELREVSGSAPRQARAEAGPGAATQRPSGPQPSVDLPPEQEFDAEEAPADPIERGPAQLWLALVAAGNGAPVASGVELWRIDAPENAAWTAGDQLQAAAAVPVEGHLFTRLPEGRYRLVCSASERESKPALIEVSAPRTLRTIALAVPRAFELRLLLCDRWGDPVPRAEVWTESSVHLGNLEPWREARRLKDARAAFSESSFSVSEAGPRRVLAGPQPADGFDLGAQLEASRGQPVQLVLGVAGPGGEQSRVRVPLRADEEVTLLALAAAPAEFAARVRLPDGRPAPARVEVWGEAIGLAQSDPIELWRDAPIRIRASLEGYRDVDRLWRPREGELPWIVLEPAE